MFLKRRYKGLAGKARTRKHKKSVDYRLDIDGVKESLAAEENLRARTSCGFLQRMMRESRELNAYLALIAERATHKLTKLTRSSARCCFVRKHSAAAGVRWPIKDVKQHTRNTPLWLQNLDTIRPTL